MKHGRLKRNISSFLIGILVMLVIFILKITPAKINNYTALCPGYYLFLQSLQGFYLQVFLLYRRFLILDC